MVALLSKFRKGDRVRVDARDEFFAFIDGERAIVAAVGPAEPNAVHCSVPGGYCAICDAAGRTFLVPQDQLWFDL
jgi:hypothetical protein